MKDVCHLARNFDSAVWVPAFALAHLHISLEHLDQLGEKHESSEPLGSIGTASDGPS
ncbi:hypothetical protein BRAS3843_990004 [Bradyrhizobium sp. STM 3843]|nr:hypothetical protein BRAS3843_990004 [Bradyrhizobium sp. STM 3843]